MNVEQTKALDTAKMGKGLNFQQVQALLDLDFESPAAASVVEAAREIGMRACDGAGYVFSQIGLDDLPCPIDCAFCNFSVSATCATEQDDASRYDHVVPLERVLHYARLFSNEGVALISLMVTAAFPFDPLLKTVEQVRAAIRPDCLLMVNAGDLGKEDYRALVQAGANAAYHAIRLGEGRLTRVQPAVRERSIQFMQEAGLRLMTGVEPLWKGVSTQELAQHICAISAMQPFAMGACAYTPVEGDAMNGMKPASKAAVRYVAAVTRLACGTSVRIGGIGGVAWVDAGCDPRNRGYGVQDEQIRNDIAAARTRLQTAGFSIEERIA